MILSYHQNVQLGARHACRQQLRCYAGTRPMPVDVHACAADNTATALSRRAITLVLPAAAALSVVSRPAAALEASETTTTSSSSSSSGGVSSSNGVNSDSSAAAPSSQLAPFLDNDYELQVPANYVYQETAIPRVERGPQPERSPVLARFEAPSGAPGTISVLARKAQIFKQTLLQVSDISQLGDPLEVARLILPRGSTLLASATQEVPQPPKTTPLGLVDIPPQSYYIYEFTTPAGLHVAMAAAAKRGSVIICGASTTADAWTAAAPVFAQVVRSFRLRAQPSIS